MTTSASVPEYAIGTQVTVKVGSKTGFHAAVEQIAWSDRDHCHYFYLTQPDRKLSRGYKADELAAASPPARASQPNLSEHPG